MKKMKTFRVNVVEDGQLQTEIQPLPGSLGVSSAASILEVFWKFFADFRQHLSSGSQFLGQ